MGRALVSCGFLVSPSLCSGHLQSSSDFRARPTLALPGPLVGKREEGGRDRKFGGGWGGGWQGRGYSLVPKMLDLLMFPSPKKLARELLCLWWCESPPKMLAAMLPAVLWWWRCCELDRDLDRDRERERSDLRRVILEDEWCFFLEVETTERPSQEASQKPIVTFFRGRVVSAGGDRGSRARRVRDALAETRIGAGRCRRPHESERLVLRRVPDSE